MAYDAQLDCPECGKRFPDFSELADHVSSVHSTSPRAESAQKVQRHMAATRSATPSTKMPTAQADERASDFNPFLKSDDIGRKIGAQANLVLSGEMRPQRSQFGDQIIIGVRHRKRDYDLGIRLNSPNHRILEECVGNDSAKWRGKKIRVTVLENMGRHYIAIDRPAASNGPKKASKKTAKRKR